MEYYAGYKESKNFAGVTTKYTLCLWPIKNLFHVASQPIYCITAENDDAAKTIAKEINNRNFIEWAARYILINDTPAEYEFISGFILKPWQRKKGIEDLILNRIKELKETGDIDYYNVNNSVGYIDDEKEINVLPIDTKEEREMILEAAPWAAELIAE